MRQLFAAFAVSAMALTSTAGAQPAPATSAQPAPVATAQPTSSGSLEAILAAASTAMGAQNLKSLPLIHISSTGTAGGLPTTLEAYTDLASGGTFADYANLGLFTQDNGYDGHSVWSRDDKGVVWVDGSQQGHDQAVNEAYRESYALWTPSHGGASITLSPAQSDGGHTYDVITVVPKGSSIPFDVWIDQATHLPARIVETAAAVTSTTLLGDYRPVGGVQVAYASKLTTSQNNVYDFHVSKVEIAPAGLASKLQKPVTDVHDFSIVGGSETSVPFELIDNHVYLNVMLNGKGPYRFLFDTGGSNVIDPAVLSEIGVTAKGSAQGGGVGASTDTVSFTRVAKLTVGKAELTDQFFSVAAVRQGFSVAASSPVDGLIGAEVLARFVTVFDYQHNRIIFKMPGAKVTGTAVPFTFTGTQPLVPCALDGIATQCSIDTGSRSSIDLFTPFIKANPSVVPADATAVGVNGFGVGGPALGSLGRLSSLEIGGFDIKNVIAGYSVATAGAFAVPGIGANIGGGVLKRFTVTFDYPHQTMSLLPGSSLDARDQNERSGMFLVNLGKIVVAAVRTGTPAAAAGIVRGDVIVGIAGIQGPLTLAAARGAMQQASGTTLQLTVLDKGATQPRTVTLTLRDYV
jgi:hypothetical protein